MSHYLVVSAIGKNRSSIVHQIASHVAECGCNIIDSRLAIFGQEFTLMMLLSGNWNSMAQVEATLPLKSQELDLVSVMKRTSEQELRSYSYSVDANIEIQDTPGILKHFTQFFTDIQAELHSLQSEIYVEEPSKTEILHARFQLSLPKGSDIEAAHQQYLDLCNTLGTLNHQFQVHTLADQ
ncbi:glycine cleavage system protein R [Dongshaea marina]|uniref:glycine cleavage system protein R n=1 Tax=Dongshaea marina TaxID=2047966 RepID=UPI000D3ECD94|nr:ACT domain-containing protein [Dongshaea marina]